MVRSTEMFSLSTIIQVTNAINLFEINRHGSHLDQGRKENTVQLVNHQNINSNTVYQISYNYHISREEQQNIRVSILFEENFAYQYYCRIKISRKNAPDVKISKPEWPNIEYKKPLYHPQITTMTEKPWHLD